jgi:hypothetical protein
VLSESRSGRNRFTGVTITDALEAEAIPLLERISTALDADLIVAISLHAAA